MNTLKDEILNCIRKTPGMTDREITNQIRGKKCVQQPINQACRQMESKGVLRRRFREDGLIGNVLMDNTQDLSTLETDQKKHPDDENLSEDETKEILCRWLKQGGWKVETAWGKKRGPDCVAEKDGKRWTIEVKGCGSRQPMRVNYFLAVIGEILQRMDDANTYYSISFPEMEQFERLWQRLPDLAKHRTGITAIFVGPNGRVRIEK